MTADKQNTVLNFLDSSGWPVLQCQGTRLATALFKQRAQSVPDCAAVVPLWGGLKNCKIVFLVNIRGHFRTHREFYRDFVHITVMFPSLLGTISCTRIAFLGSSLHSTASNLKRQCGPPIHHVVIHTYTWITRF